MPPSVLPEKKGIVFPFYRDTMAGDIKYKALKKRGKKTAICI
jgi:hypothetical protein